MGFQRCGREAWCKRVAGSTNIRPSSGEVMLLVPNLLDSWVDSNAAVSVDPKMVATPRHAVASDDCGTGDCVRGRPGLAPRRRRSAEWCPGRRRQVRGSGMATKSRQEDCGEKVARIQLMGLASAAGSHWSPLSLIEPSGLHEAPSSLLVISLRVVKLLLKDE